MCNCDTNELTLSKTYFVVNFAVTERNVDEKYESVFLIDFMKIVLICKVEMQIPFHFGK